MLCRLRAPFTFCFTSAQPLSLHQYRFSLGLLGSLKAIYLSHELSWFITIWLTSDASHSLVATTVQMFSVFHLLYIQGFFLFCCVFAITKHCSKVRLLECAAVLLMCVSLFPQTFHCIYSSQAWHFQMQTYTTVPSINKPYIINGKWKHSPSPPQGFCSRAFARKIISHLFLTSGLSLLTMGLTFPLFMSAFLTLQSFNETL